mmetsp:Transcript_74027/g.228785  ORF Transcript_74027/g.228785 Transcript_74027/m.228785 type:complete len:316 (-) Transcript_74027:174-1121(-)
MAPLSRAAWRVLPFAAVSLWRGSCLSPQRARAEQAAAANNEPAEKGPLRHLFVAGVLGTGLDFWTTIMRECIKGEVCEPRDSSFYTTMMYQSREADIEKAWGRQRPKKEKKDRLLPMNLISPREGVLPDNMFTQAFLGKTHSGNRDPLLGMYAKAAEHHGDSLKVLVLTRQSEQDLLAWAMRQTKKSAEEAEAATVQSVLSLAAQVRELPKGSYRCQRYEDQQAFGEYLSPLIGMKKDFADDLIHNVQIDSAKENQGCKRKRKCAAAPKLRAALDELEALCRPEDLGLSSQLELNLRELREREAAYASKLRWLMA